MPRRLCHSAFARVATSHAPRLPGNPAFATAHSRGLRRKSRASTLSACSLPQRIRAGCDPADSPVKACTFLCHSAFARVATIRVCMVSLDELLCHSAFARVATIEGNKPLRTIAFATAHSRGLRRVRQAYVQQAHSFATAHSRGLRLSSAYFYWSEQPLPQRIRAGCDACYPKACSFDFALPQRIRAGCDCIRRNRIHGDRLCHSAFARVAT